MTLRQTTITPKYNIRADTDTYISILLEDNTPLLLEDGIQFLLEGSPIRASLRNIIETEKMNLRN